MPLRALTALLLLYNLKGMRAVIILMLGYYILGQFLSCSTPARTAYIRGLELQTEGDYEKAIEYYLKGLETDPDSPLLNFRLGECLAKLERWEEAMKALKKFLALTEKDAGSWKKERWEANFYIGKAEQALGIKRSKQSDRDDRFTDDEDFLGGIRTIVR